MKSRWKEKKKHLFMKDLGFPSNLSTHRYGKIGSKIVLLLSGGDKGSQNRDIEKAKEYLKDYQSRGSKYGKK